MEAPNPRLATLIDELRGILEEERRALLSGGAAAISEIAQRKSLVAERIEEATLVPGAPRPDPEALGPLARYNRKTV
jgi:hypothetical protein